MDSAEVRDQIGHRPLRTRRDDRCLVARGRYPGGCLEGGNLATEVGDVVHGRTLPDAWRPRSALTHWWRTRLCMAGAHSAWDQRRAECGGTTRTWCPWGAGERVSVGSRR